MVTRILSFTFTQGYGISGIRTRSVTTYDFLLTFRSNYGSIIFVPLLR